MGIELPTTQEIIDQSRAYLEARLAQTTPAADRAYNNVVAGMTGLAFTALRKYGADRILAAFAQTAVGADLDLIGAEYDTARKQAVAAVHTVTLTGTNGTDIPAGTVFVADANGALYSNNALGTIAAGTVTLTLTAQVPGVGGNLIVTDTLKLQSQIPGATGVPTVASTVTTGAEAEGDDAYRVRVLDVQRSQGGGGNGADYRNWGQEVTGVVRCYPYSGPPSGTSNPPMRTVYVECDTSIHADGIAPAGLLIQVRAAITTDPDTGLSRQPLGLTDGTLYVQAITRTPIYMQITSLIVPSGQTAQCQAAIAVALTSYFLAVSPFIAGLDPAFGRNDSITNLSVSRVVQAVLTQYGASAANIGFGLSASSFNSVYTVGSGEKTKLAAVAYV